MRRANAQQLGHALQHLNAGDLAAADAACAAIEASAPSDPAVLQLRAVIALRSGKAQLARKAAGCSLRARPSHAPTMLLAAQAAMALGEPACALPLLTEILAQAAQPEATFLLCHACLAAGAPLDDAMGRAAALYPADAARWQALALALQRAGRPVHALAAFAQAAAADPALAAAQFGLGLLLREAGRLAQARDALQRATSLDGAASAAWFALGLTQQDLGDDASAAASYQQALATRPDFAEAAVNLGIARQSLGEMAAAMEAYRRAYAIRPDTLGRIAQAVTAASTGTLWLDPAGLRRALGG